MFPCLCFFCADFPFDCSLNSFIFSKVSSSVIVFPLVILDRVFLGFVSFGFSCGRVILRKEVTSCSKDDLKRN